MTETKTRQSTLDDLVRFLLPIYLFNLQKYIVFYPAERVLTCLFFQTAHLRDGV